MSKRFFKMVLITSNVDFLNKKCNILEVVLSLKFIENVPQNQFFFLFKFSMSEQFFK